MKFTKVSHKNYYIFDEFHTKRENRYVKLQIGFGVAKIKKYQIRQMSLYFKKNVISF